eukprot:6487695-Amphidinium_carterae.1
MLTTAIRGSNGCCLIGIWMHETTALLKRNIQQRVSSEIAIQRVPFLTRMANIWTTCQTNANCKNDSVVHVARVEVVDRIAGCLSGQLVWGCNIFNHSPSLHRTTLTTNKLGFQALKKLFPNF